VKPEHIPPAFISSALVFVVALPKNWDLKMSNNKLYIVTNSDGNKEPRHVVRDLGSSLGKAKQVRVLSWFPFMRHRQGSKNDLEDFEAQGFVRAIKADRVEFDYRGVNDPLVNNRVTAADLRWTCDLTPVASRLAISGSRSDICAPGWTHLHLMWSRGSREAA
jgi:hypothetical protein